MNVARPEQDKQRPMATYGAKRLQLETESTFELTTDRLTRTVGGKPHEQIVLADVRSVRITSMPTDIVECWVCTVKGRHGSLWIPSATYPTVGRAEDQRAAFRPFAQALTASIAEQTAGHAVAFERGGGLTRLLYLLLAIVTAVMTALLALMGVGSLLNGGFPFGLLLAAGCGVVALTFWRFWRSRPPAAFDPRALPPDIAPLVLTERY
jgi:hypothetical protein